MGGYETLQPWFVNAWQRQKRRTEDTLLAFYSESKADFLEYCGRYGVTHLLINKGPFGADFRKQARVVQPFNSFLDELLADVELSNLALVDVPSTTVVYENERFQLVEVERLRAARKK